MSNSRVPKRIKANINNDSNNNNNNPIRRQSWFSSREAELFRCQTRILRKTFYLLNDCFFGNWLRTWPRNCVTYITDEYRYYLNGGSNFDCVCRISNQFSILNGMALELIRKFQQTIEAWGMMNCFQKKTIYACFSFCSTNWSDNARIIHSHSNLGENRAKVFCLNKDFLCLPCHTAVLNRFITQLIISDADVDHFGRCFMPFQAAYFRSHAIISTLSVLLFIYLYQSTWLG